MILFVTFTNNSKPWVFCGDRHQVAKHWRRWMKYHPDTAQPVAMCGKWELKNDIEKPGYFFLLGHWEHRRYQHLGHALVALEKLGGENE